MTGRALLLALALAACAPDPLASGSFPCAADGTCPESLTCTAGAGSDPVAAVCMDGCARSTDCEEGSRCAQVGDTAACLGECTPFGSDCEGPSTCRLQPLAGGEGFFATCIAVGGGGDAFAVCQSAVDCPPQATCFRASDQDPPTCHPQCDDDHPCRGRAQTCEPLVPSGAGVCVER